MLRRIQAAGLSAAVLLALAACGAQSLSANAGDAPTNTPEPTITPWPTPTPKPLPPTPTNVPAGWQVYAVADAHFSIAYPGSMLFAVRQNVQSSSTPSQRDVIYEFTSANTSEVDGTGMPIEMQIGEGDGMSPDVVQRICSETTVIAPLAGLPMRQSPAQPPSGNRFRSWTFVTDRGTVYGLTLRDATASADIQAQDDQILATFRPQFTTPGCP